jgi:sec-independent protein translocase protein TatC
MARSTIDPPKAAKPKKAKPKKAGKVASNSETMTLIEHLTELRQRIVKSVLAIAIGAAIVFLLFNPILRFLRQPFDDICLRNHYPCSLQATDPLDPIATRMKIAGYGGIVLALPVLLWQVWRFVVPALHAKEKKYAVPFIATSIALFALGASIAYWTLGKALEFLINWSGENIAANYTIGKYVRLVTLMMMAFGGGFLFPVLLVFLQLVGVLTPKALIGWWRQAIVLIIVVAAVITPSGDPYSLFALAVPMWIFYFMSAGIGALVTRNRPKPEPALRWTRFRKPLWTRSMPASRSWWQHQPARAKRSSRNTPSPRRWHAVIGRSTPRPSKRCRIRSSTT